MSSVFLGLANTSAGGLPDRAGCPWPRRRLARLGGGALADSSDAVGADQGFSGAFAGESLLFLFPLEAIGSRLEVFGIRLEAIAHR